MNNEQKLNNQCSHRHAVKHTEDCEDDYCPICKGGLFVCADCGAAEAQLYEVHCVDRLKHQWQMAVSLAAGTVVDNWETDVTPNRAQVRLTKLLQNMEERTRTSAETMGRIDRMKEMIIRLTKERDVAENRVVELEKDLANADAMRRQAELRQAHARRNAEAKLREYRERLENAERKLREYRDGGLQIAANIHSANDRADAFEKRVAELVAERDKLAAATGQALREAERRGNPTAINWREGLLRRQAEDRLRRVREIVNEMPGVGSINLTERDFHPPEVDRYMVDPTTGEKVLVRPGFACPHCGHRHPPDGGCV